METYHGHVKTPNDAIILFEACRLGHLPRVQRRLSEKERQSIKSGSVFVWDEREAGMRRWTDGKSWSASRVSGSFLTYREMEGKRGGSSFSSPMQGPGQGANGGDRRNKEADGDAGAEGPDGYRYKPDGLMKQSFSITTTRGQHLHLISYYARSHPSAVNLTQPANDPALRSIRPEKGMYPESTMHDAPAVTRSPMTASPYTTSPRHAQSQNYLRHPPPNVQHPGYGWPPSPVDTPPNHLHQHQHQQQQAHYPHSGQPASGSTHPSPMYPPQPYQMQSRGPGPTAFDRAPPPMRNGGLPPPPPPPGPHTNSSYAYPPPSNSMPGYQHPSPYPQPARNSQMPPTRDGSTQYNNSPYAYSYPPQQPQTQNIDPRLNQTAPQPSSYLPPKYDLPPPPPPPPSLPIPPPSNNAANTSASAVKTIPSIGSLMNPASPPSTNLLLDNNGRNEETRMNPISTERPTAPLPPRASERIGSKMGFGEDSRLLRQLDRATLRG